jgi:hypothetical protein
MEAAITFLQSNERIDEHVHVCYGCSLQTRNILNAAGGGLVVVSKYYDVGLLGRVFRSCKNVILSFFYLVPKEAQSREP